MPQSLSNLIMHLKPYWLDSAAAVVPLVLGEGPGIDIVGSTIGLGGDTILLYNSDGTPVEEFAATEAGVIAALAAAASGNNIDFPYNITIALTAGITIPTGVYVNNAKLSFSGFSGNAVTMANNSNLGLSYIYFDGTGETDAIAIYANGVACNISNTAAIAENATNNTGIFAKGTSRHVGVNISFCTGRGNNGTINHGLYLLEYSYAAYCFGQASSTGTNAGVVFDGSVSGAYNAPLAYACYFFGTESNNSYGGRIAANKYGTASNCHFYGLKSTGADSTGIEVGANAVFYVNANDWNTLTNSGTITYLQGDRGAYSVEDYHATDIEAAALTRHNPLPGAAGGIPYSNGTNWTRVDLADYAGVSNTATITAGTTTLDGTYDVVLCNAAGGAITVNLPAVASNTGRAYSVKKIDSSANTVTIDGNASETIDGATTQVISYQWTSLTIVCDGTGWYII